MIEERLALETFDLSPFSHGDAPRWPDCRSPGYRIAKRLLDIFCSAVFLFALSPILLLTALAIKASSRGPVFFVQWRVGKGGRLFPMLKFRSMFVGCDQGYHKQRTLQHISSKSIGGVQFKNDADPRITPVGRFIRKWSVDELPQFVNVLAGQMSLVGPRPCLPYEFEVYDSEYRRRVCVSPGLTGLMQVSGRVCLSFEDMVALDLHYVQKSSFWMDLVVLAKTPLAVINGDGAS